MKLQRTEWAAIALSAVFLIAAIAMTFTGSRNGGVAYTPLSEETAAESDISAQTAAEETEKLNINTATEAELQTLPGIGPTLAARIVEYRVQHGAFHTPEELLNISGMGEKTYAGLAEQITVGTAEQEETE